MNEKMVLSWMSLYIMDFKAGGLLGSRNNMVD